MKAILNLFNTKPNLVLMAVFPLLFGLFFLFTKKNSWIKNNFVFDPVILSINASAVSIINFFLVWSAFFTWFKYKKIYFPLFWKIVLPVTSDTLFFIAIGYISLLLLRIFFKDQLIFEHPILIGLFLMLDFVLIWSILFLYGLIEYYNIV